ncbi:MAG: methyltransferase domain-containing protein [Bacteroidota bacterium]
MATEYDSYYQTENLFGAPYPELLSFYESLPEKGKLLDLGCGQGRDAIALARMGYEVIGIDSSKVGIEQLNAIAAKENLSLRGIVADIYTYADFGEFDHILLDSMFHFGKKGRAKEEKLLQGIIQAAKVDTLITICIQKTGKKLEILKSICSESKSLELYHESSLTYTFEDKESGHTSTTEYALISMKKI